jgi:tripartite-type tricarboxylate transporter receptor subunit TctC
MMKKLLFILIFFNQLCFAQSYPNRPITIVVPYPPGGVSDALARGIAQKLSLSLNQSVLVENKPGGNTLIGAGYVSKANSDGYTLLLTAEATLTMNPMMYAKLPYNIDKNFSPIIALASVPQSLIVSNKVNVKDLNEFINLAKKNNTPYSYANLGTGSTAHLNFELFEKEAGIHLTAIPYKGASAALTDIMGSHVDAMIVSTGLVASQAKAGNLKMLAIAGNKRLEILPDVPTFKETGLKDFQPSSWFALMGVSGTPKDIIERLNFEINKMLKDPAFKVDQLDKFMLEPIGGTPDQLRSLIKTDTTKWQQIITDKKIKLDE